jgi:hypothetical protein
VKGGNNNQRNSEILAIGNWLEGTLNFECFRVANVEFLGINEQR